MFFSKKSKSGQEKQQLGSGSGSGVAPSLQNIRVGNAASRPLNIETGLKSSDDATDSTSSNSNSNSGGNRSIGGSRSAKEQSYSPIRKPTGSGHSRNSSFNSTGGTTPLSRSFSKASMRFILGHSLPAYKQLKMAILEGNEAKAIGIYSGEGSNNKEKLMDTLLPSEPFPSNKIPADPETPLHMACKEALPNLVALFVQHKGNPACKNDLQECSLHSTCLSPHNSDARSQIIETLLQWRGTKGVDDPLVLQSDSMDIEGNTALHYAAYNGLQPCVEALCKEGSSLSILNRSNKSCMDMADLGNFFDLGTALELAWLYQPVDKRVEAKDHYHRFSNEGLHLPLLYLDCNSLTLASLIEFVDKSIQSISDSLGETKARSEVGG